MPKVKNKRGRPPRTGRIYVQIKLTLDVETDADLVEWFRNIAEGNRSNAVITALRQGRSVGSATTHGDAESEDFIPDDDFEAMLEML